MGLLGQCDDIRDNILTARIAFLPHAQPHHGMAASIDSRQTPWQHEGKPPERLFARLNRPRPAAD